MPTFAVGDRVTSPFDAHDHTPGRPLMHGNIADVTTDPETYSVAWDHRYTTHRGTSRRGAGVVTAGYLPHALELDDGDDRTGRCQCAGTRVAGVLHVPGENGEDSIERCDMCERFEGDLDAALALLRSYQPNIPGKVLFECGNPNNDWESYSVAGDGDETGSTVVACFRTAADLEALGEIMIARGTDPWIEFD